MERNAFTATIVKTIDGYLGRRLFLLSFYALLALVGLDCLIDFASGPAMSSVGSSWPTMLLDVVWDLPERISVFFPFAVLVGSVLAMGQLTAQLELEAAFLLGYSYSRLVVFLLLFALLSSAVMMVVTELAIVSSENSPYSENEDVKPFGYWFRERNRVIHAGRVVRNADTTSYHDVQFFEMDPAGKLIYLINASSLLVDEQSYHFKQARVTHFKKEKPAILQSREYTVPRMLTAAGKDLEVPRPEQLHIMDLARYVNRLKLSMMRSELFELALWERFARPLSIPIMLLLTLPFLFFNLHKRYSSGVQLLMAIVLGASYWIASQAIANAAIIWGLPAALAAFGTHLLCFVALMLYFLFLYFRARRKGVVLELVRWS